MSISQNFPEEGPTLNLNFAGSKTLDPRITFSRTTTGTYMDANGLIVTAPADAPRFDHRYVNGEIESLGLLVEEQRSNLVTYSEKIGGLFSSYGWANQNSITVDVDTTDVSDPSGGNSASKLTNGSSSPVSQTLKTCSLSATVYTASVYLRTLSGTETASINVFLQSSPYTTIATSGVLTITSEWRRYDITTSTATSANYNLGIQVRSGTIYAWGAQLEAGAFPTSYIPTSGSTATRNHDRVYYENVDQTEWFNKTEGTVVFEHTDVPYSSSTPVGYPAVGFARTSDGSSASAIQYFFTKNYGAAQYLVRITPGNDSANIDPPGGTGSAAPASKVGFVYKANDYALVRNGSLVGTDDSGAVPDAYMLIFGMNGVTATEPNWNAHLKNLQYYPTRLSNTVLQNLTK